MGRWREAPEGQAVLPIHGRYRRRLSSPVLPCPPHSWGGGAKRRRGRLSCPFTGGIAAGCPPQSSPFMGRWREAPEGQVVLPIHGEARRRLSSPFMRRCRCSSPFMGRWREAPEGQVVQERQAGSGRIRAVGDYESRIDDLRARRKKNLAMGGEEKIARQHERGKLHVRERIDLLFDPGTFVELGLLAKSRDGSDDD